MVDFLNSYFKISERNSKISTEILGGITTFLAMSYIIFVNPSLLAESGMDRGALITVTCVASAIGTLIVAFWANVPFALAPGMGLNAFFTYSLCLEKQVPWEVALGVVFISGLFFFILSLGGIREKIADSIPMSIKIAVGAGIGMFITFIGLKGMGIVVANPATLVGLGHISNKSIAAIVGLFIALIMEIKGKKGGMLVGIVVTTVFGIFINDVQVPTQILSAPPSMAPIAFKLDILGALKISLAGPIFSFMFVDLFDSLGTLMTCAKEMHIVDNKGKIKGLGRMLYADVASTIIGATLGTSTVTTFVESTAGVVTGARTGLASVVTGICFLLALIFTPLVSIVPDYAASTALIIVGGYMFKHVKDLDFNDFKTIFPAFIIIILTPLTYSISIGLSFGFLTYIIIHILTGDFKKLNFTLLFIGILSFVNLIVG